MVFAIYTEPLKNPNDMEEGPVKDAYVSWREQRTRCYNKKRAKYKNYGAKGIEVKYTSREFIGWWLQEIKKFNGEDPTIARIDHDGHYEFGNVRIESRSDNSKERGARLGPFMNYRAINVYDKDFKFIERIEGISVAAEKYRVRPSYIYEQCKLQYKKTMKGLFFRYAEAS